jgi:hypothetical protein
MCSAIPKAAHFKYADTDAMGKAICESGKDVFCGGTDDQVNTHKVCEHQDQLSQDILYETSMRSVCEADPAKLCYDRKYKDQVCKSDGQLVENYCEAGLFPEKCAVGTSTYDVCAQDWFACMLDPEWRYCDSFPELCNLEGPPVIATQADIDRYICELDSNKYCQGGITFSLENVCSSID